MKENYDKCLEMILHHEGGYVNHPKDPGGETNLGVTKRVYEQWVMENDLLTKDMKDLEFEDVAPIYRKITGIGSKQIRYLMVLICVSLIFLLMRVLGEEQSIYRLLSALLLMVPLALIHLDK